MAGVLLPLVSAEPPNVRDVNGVEAMVKKNNNGQGDDEEENEEENEKLEWCRKETKIPSLENLDPVNE